MRNHRVRTATGSVISIEHAAIAPIEKLVIPITLKQQGSGDSSPNNIRPLDAATIVELKMLNAILDDGLLKSEMIYDTEFSYHGQTIVFKSFELNPLTRNLKLDSNSSYALTEDELVKFLKLVHVRYKVYAHELGLAVLQGSLDFLSGKLMSEYKQLVLDGSKVPELPYYQIGKLKQFHFTIRNEDLPAKTTKTEMVGSHHKAVSFLEMNKVDGAAFYASPTSQTLIFTLPGIESVEGCVNYLKNQNGAGTPVTFAWKLANPVIRNLSPKQIKTFHGSNTIWTNLGEVL